MWGLISWSIGWFLIGFGLGWHFADYLNKKKIEETERWSSEYL